MMTALVPSPIGHVLGGVAVAWLMPAPTPGTNGEAARRKLAALCGVVAALPDLDLLYMPMHRRATHSIPVAILFTIIAVGVTAWVTRRRSADRRFAASVWIALALGAAWASHMLLDWMGMDTNPPQGIQMWWPFSDEWFMSGWDLFPRTERRDPLGARAMLINLRAAVQETAMMGAVVVAIRWARQRLGTRK